MRYTAASVQCGIVAGAEQLEAAVDHVGGIVRRLADDYEDLRLVVFPEYLLTGFDRDRSPESWAESALRMPGPELDALGAAAGDAGIYLAGASYEYDPDWPGRRAEAQDPET